MTADLAAFLTAQLDEIERAARAATPGPWEWDSEEFKDAPSSACPHGTEWTDHGPNLKSLSAREYEDRATVISARGYDASNVNVKRADAAHIALHDPEFVLDWVEFARWVVATFTPPNLIEYDWPEVLRRLAAVYRSHPDFDPAWTEQ